MAKRPSAPVAVLTGASTGLGLALARKFAAAGHGLLLVARDEADLKAAAAAIGKETGADVAIHVVAADLASAEGCRRVERALSRHGLHARYLVNNAAIGLSGPFADHDSDDLMRLVDLNMRGLTALTRALLPGMIARGSGGVLNIASMGGFGPGPWQAVYFASKAYVISLSEALAHEVRGTGVHVSVSAPGPFASQFHNRMGSQNDFYIRFLGMQYLEKVARITYAKFMRGQTIIVPGIVHLICSLFVRAAPHVVLTPFTAWLLARREGGRA